MKCKKCQAEIPASQINISTDLAHCKSCNSIFNISDITFQKDPLFDIKHNPKGTWYERVNSGELKIGASTRSPFAFFIVPFMLIWSGGSLGGIYGTQILNGEFDLFISLFGIPFLIGTIVLATYALMTITGRVEITMNKQGGRVFTGIGSFGYSKGFLWNEVSEIKELTFAPSSVSRSGKKIALEGKRRITFGILLRESRHYYILKALKKVHFNVQTNNSLSF